MGCVIEADPKYKDYYVKDGSMAQPGAVVWSNTHAKAKASLYEWILIPNPGNLGGATDR